MAKLLYRNKKTELRLLVFRMHVMGEGDAESEIPMESSIFPTAIGNCEEKHDDGIATLHRRPLSDA